MKKVFYVLVDEIKKSEERYGINAIQVRFILSFPIAVVCGFIALMLFPYTRSAAWWMIQENNPSELLTFLFLIIGGIYGLLAARRFKNKKEEKLVVGFYILFSIGLLFTAMEEIAWGQWFIKFQTPVLIKEINLQGELTLHNIRGLQGHSEYFRLIFGLGGLAGVLTFFYKPFRKIGAPMLLMPSFFIITFFAGLDLYDDYFPCPQQIRTGLYWLSEVLEMLVGFSGMLFIWLNERFIMQR